MNLTFGDGGTERNFYASFQGWVVDVTFTDCDQTCEVSMFFDHIEWDDSIGDAVLCGDSYDGETDSGGPLRIAMESVSEFHVC